MQTILPVLIFLHFIIDLHFHCTLLLAVSAAVTLSMCAFYFPPWCCCYTFFSVLKAMKGRMHVCMLSCFSRVWLFATLWTVAHQAPLSMGFSRQDYWSGLPCPPPWDLPDPGVEPISLMFPALAGGFFIISATWEAQRVGYFPWNHACFSTLQLQLCLVLLL